MRRRLKFSFVIGLAILFVVFVILPLVFNYKALSAEKKVSTGFDNERFIEKIAPKIQRVSSYYGIMPSILIAQSANDSDFGRNLLAAKYHNIFGVKASQGEDEVRLKTVQRDEGQMLTSDINYVVYSSWDQALLDYMARLKDGRLANKKLYYILATSNNISISTQAFYRYNYTQDDDYANKLEKLIKQYNLTKYDKVKNSTLK